MFLVFGDALEWRHAVIVDAVENCAEPRLYVQCTPDHPAFSMRAKLTTNVVQPDISLWVRTVWSSTAISKPGVYV